MIHSLRSRWRGTRGRHRRPGFLRPHGAAEVGEDLPMARTSETRTQFRRAPQRLGLSERPVSEVGTGKIPGCDTTRTNPAKHELRQPVRGLRTDGLLPARSGMRRGPEHPIDERRRGRFAREDQRALSIRSRERGGVVEIDTGARRRSP